MDRKEGGRRGREGGRRVVWKEGGKGVWNEEGGWKEGGMGEWNGEGRRNASEKGRGGGTEEQNERLIVVPQGELFASTEHALLLSFAGQSLEESTSFVDQEWQSP